MDTQWTDDLRAFARALLDLDRLKIVGELSKGRGRVTELAEEMGMDPATVRQHLETLTGSGVVSLSSSQGEALYVLDTENLERMARRNFTRVRQQRDQTPDRRVIGTHFTEAEARVIRTFTRKNGLITALPAVHKKRLVLLRYVLQAVETDRTYTEAEINQVFLQFSADTATLRRYLVDLGYLDRNMDGTEYRRVEGKDA